MNNLFQGKSWAIHPAKLDEISLFFEKRFHLEDLEKNSVEKIAVKAGKSGNKASETFQVSDGTAIIPVFGTISKRVNMLTDFSGGTSTELLKRDISKALEDPKVSSIILDIDSPGGSVEGTKELSDFIYKNRGKKPITAFTDGMMASAAYWIGSAADKIIASDTAIIGSIGVAMTHYDVSAKDAQKGVVRTQISAGKYKRIASDEKPLSEEGREYLQSMVDTYYSMFVEGVARNRGVSIESALQMADGKDFIGKQALETGLIDGISSEIEQLMEKSNKRLDGTLLETLPKTLPKNSYENFKTSIHELMKTGKTEQQALEELGFASEDDYLKITNEEKETLSTTTISAIEAFEKKIESHVASGLSKADAVRKTVNDNPELHQDYLVAYRDRYHNLKQSENPQQKPGAKFWEQCKTLELTKGLSKADAVRETVRLYPELHQEYLNSLSS